MRNFNREQVGVEEEVGDINSRNVAEKEFCSTGLSGCFHQQWCTYSVAMYRV
ncbi:hypothetical protein Sjap_021216 [Stephania japonica]|uniref:Uncharacterized protein n=1 Tax=Stephania japonica TaxID=461633 RepID=A0AAP0HZN6_9MAGN